MYAKLHIFSKFFENDIDYKFCMPNISKRINLLFNAEQYLLLPNGEHDDIFVVT